MNDSEDIKARVKKFASGYQPKLPRKLALLLPFKTKIEELLKLRASHDDIRLLLEDVNVIVSTDTAYRFCRKVIGQKPVRERSERAKKITPFKMLVFHISQFAFSIFTRAQPDWNIVGCKKCLVQNEPKM